MSLEPIQARLDRLLEACLRDERVVALLVYGSHAAGREDAFSDLDIGLVTTDDGLDDVVAELESFVRAGGEPLFSEHFGDPQNLHVIYADGGALELIVAAEGDLSIEGPHRVLYDRTGAVERAMRRPRPNTVPEVPREDVRRLVVWFWHDVEHLVTAIGRGQTWWAYGQLDELRRIYLDLARLDAGSAIEPDEAYWKLDEALPVASLDAVRDTVAPLAVDAILDAAGALLRTYRELAPRLAAAHGIAYPSELDRLVSDRLSELGVSRGP